MWASLHPRVKSIVKLRSFAVGLFAVLTGVILFTGGNTAYADNLTGQWVKTDEGLTAVRVGTALYFNPTKDGNNWYMQENAAGVKCQSKIYFGDKNPLEDANAAKTAQQRFYREVAEGAGTTGCMEKTGDRNDVTISGSPSSTTTDPGAGTGTGEGVDKEQVCQVGALGWIICPLINFTTIATAQVASILQVLMFVQPLSLDTGASNNLYLAWSSILGVANVLLAIAFLFVIFAQATSVGLSSYGVKKMLPRIIAAAILMNLSYYICAIAVDISNLAGIGVSGLLVGVTNGAVTTDVFNPDTLSAKIGTSETATAIAGAGVLAIVAYFFLVPVLIAALAVLFTLAARLAIIVLLVMIAPIAFAAWVLPNTEKYFKKWNEIFIGMLALFPMVMAIFAAASVASKMITAQSVQSSVGENAAIGINNSVTNSLLLPLIALLIQAMPLFILPLLFKTSSTVLSRLNDMSRNLTRRGYDNTKKAYQESNFGKYRAGQKAERNALIAGGNYQGKNPLRRARSAANRGLNSIMGGYGDQRQTVGENLFEKRQAEEASTLAKRHVINNTPTGDANTEGTLVHTALHGKSDVQRRAAMEALAQTQSIGALRDVRAAIGDNRKGNEIFNRVMSNHGSMFSSAPDLNPAHGHGYDGFGKVSAQKTSGWHDSTIRAASADADNAYAAYQRDAHRLNDPNLRQEDRDTILNNQTKRDRLAAAYSDALSDPRIAPGLDNRQRGAMEAYLRAQGRPIPAPPAPGAAPGPAQGGGAPQGGGQGPVAPQGGGLPGGNRGPGQSPAGAQNFQQQSPGGIWLPGGAAATAANPQAPQGGATPNPGPNQTPPQNVNRNNPTPGPTAPTGVWMPGAGNATPTTPPQGGTPTAGPTTPPNPGTIFGPTPTTGPTPGPTSTGPATPSAGPTTPPANSPSGTSTPRVFNIAPDGNLVVPRGTTPPTTQPSNSRGGFDENNIWRPGPRP